MERVNHFLRGLVGDVPFEGEFKWCRGNLIDHDSDYLHMSIEGKERPVSFSYFAVLNSSDAKPIYTLDPADISVTLPGQKEAILIAKGTLRPAREPHNVKGLFGIYTILTPVLLVATLVFRLVQTVVFVVAVIFRVMKEFYPDRLEKDSAERFADIVEEKFRMQRAELSRIWANVVQDFKMATAMEISALVGTATQDLELVMRMQVVFAAAEARWNKGADPSHTPLSAFIRLWNVLEAHQGRVTTELFLKEVIAKFKESNSAVYLCQCGQPITKQEEVRIIGDESSQFFASYGAMQEHIEKVIARATAQVAAQS